MNTIGFKELKTKPDQTFAKVCNDFEPCLVIREDNNNVVILSQKEYDSIMETFYLLKSPKNAERLLRSLDHAREGKR